MFVHPDIPPTAGCGRSSTSVQLASPWIVGAAMNEGKNTPPCRNTIMGHGCFNTVQETSPDFAESPSSLMVLSFVIDRRRDLVNSYGTIEEILNNLFATLFSRPWQKIYLAFREVV